MTNNYIVDNERQTQELLQEEHQRRSKYLNNPQYLIQWYGHSHPEKGMIFKTQKECTNFISDYAFIYGFDIDVASKGSNRIEYVSKCKTKNNLFRLMGVKLLILGVIQQLRKHKLNHF